MGLQDKRMSSSAREFSKKLGEIKIDLAQGYLESKGAERPKVLFTVRDTHIRRLEELTWRYWIGIDRNDISAAQNVHERLYIFLGAGEVGDNKAPCTFVEGLDVSGSAKPGRNWMLLEIPQNLNGNSHPMFKHHALLEVGLFNGWLEAFLEMLFNEAGLKTVFHHQKDARNRSAKRSSLYRAAKLTFDSAFKNHPNLAAIKKAIMEFGVGREKNLPDDLHAARSEARNGRTEATDEDYFGYLMRAIDYYCIFNPAAKEQQGNSHSIYVLSYAFILGGYHSFTFYLIIPTVTDGAGTKTGYGSERWGSITELLSVWQEMGSPKILPNWVELVNVTDTLGEIEDIIKLGWADCVNSALATLAHDEALKGNEIEKVLEDAIKLVLLMSNPEGASCALPSDQDCKYLIKKAEDPISKKLRREKCPSDCELIGNPSIYLRLPIKEGEKEKEIPICFLKTEGDSHSSKIVLERILKSFVHLYSEAIVPMRTNLERSAIISIIIDSFSHNISAHSLSALEWWFRSRSARYLEEKIMIEDRTRIRFVTPNALFNHEDLLEIQKRATEFRNDLGLTKEKAFITLFDIVQYGLEERPAYLLEADISKTSGTDVQKHPVPVPLDFYVSRFFRFLRDKAAFWGGATRDLGCGGIKKTWFEVLWEDFINNPLYLGTIAATEGVRKLKFLVGVDGGTPEVLAVVDLPVIEPEMNGKLSGLAGKDLYRFVSPGDDFVKLRAILDTEPFSLFLPEGLVGEHALFTIIENCIRNVKHYPSDELNNIRSNGLEIVLTLENMSITDAAQQFRNANGMVDRNPNKQVGSDGQTKNLYKLKLWLNHKIKLTKEVEGKQIPIVLDMAARSKQRIVDDHGKPRLGGNSQDKVCAAMLFNNEFISVEDRRDWKGEQFYPWIGFCHQVDSDKIEYCPSCTEIGDYLKYLDGGNLENIRPSEKSQNGYIKKCLHLWKAEDMFVLEDVNQLERENISRFKFVCIPNNSEMGSDLKRYAAEHGIIRILENDDGKGGIGNAYAKWLSGWLGDAQIIINKGETPLVLLSFNPYPTIIVHNDRNNRPETYLIANRLKGTRSFKVAHREPDAGTCTIRNHGVLIKKYFDQDGVDADHLERLVEKYVPLPLLYELIEILGTNVGIIDDRIYQRTRGKRSVLDSLGLSIFGEENTTIDKGIITQNDFSIEISKLHFLIIHLSYIEKIGYKETDIRGFINQKLSIHKPNFRFVLTTGRGRTAFQNEIKEYSNLLLFKPIESILSAVEYGLAINDDIQIKHDVIKVLFGS